MGRLLVHIATGPENPTRAALGLLVARTAAEAGHEVDLFIAGDGVGILRPETLELGVGIGTGSMREHVDVLVARGARFYLSGLSSKARGISLESLGGLGASGATLAPPSKLVELTFEADRVLTY
jgi:predicted peroxiredoxin